ncbi:unnamed protein product [Eruca vesicaria subsp. sativa]|uniref:F-box associated beta-propeller type 3 domain-containing protein n=1 Tax=Eruca vesicaria subsp. sativa TaxID=29727 RepID=A0ABC8LIV7_ERUVS|nr:unnamed protein product [Eruca vesicaria subsp. sativa]
MKWPGEHCYFSTMDSVHGLICIEDLNSNTPLVWNPSTGQLLLLPKPPNMNSKYINVFLGYDPVQGKHKVVCLPYEKTSHFFRVFTLRSGQESWRTVGTHNLKHKCRGYGSDRCINGVIYYLASGQGYNTFIMSFNVRFEIFSMIELPSGNFQDVLISYKGKLACVDRYNETRLLILEDAYKHKWSFQNFLFPLYMWNLKDSSEEPNLFKLKGCTYDGEFIYVPYGDHNNRSYIIFYDPVRNSCRRLKFEGLVDEEKFGFKLHVFPNHIESIVSL